MPASGERFEEALARHGVRIEHIVSSEAPEPVVYVQDHDEWVLLLSGAAELEVQGRTVRLVPDEHFLLTTGVPHRVVRTDAGTRWLAVHLPAPPG